VLLGSLYPPHKNKFSVMLKLLISYYSVGWKISQLWVKLINGTLLPFYSRAYNVSIDMWYCDTSVTQKDVPQ